MRQSRLYRQREELKQLVAITALSQEEKKRWSRLVPRMRPSELLRLKRNLLQELLVDAEFEVANEVGERKLPARVRVSLFELVVAKVLRKVDQVEERSRGIMEK